MANKKVKRKLNVKGLFVILLTLYLLVMLVYYVFTMPIKTIVIKGNTVLKDNEIIMAAELQDYPSLFGTSSHSIKKKIASLDMVDQVNIKKTINGTLTIDIAEEKILFYNKATEKYVLSNNKEIDLEKNVLGVPTLINYTQNDVYEKLIKKMADIDTEIIYLISEIEYSPDIKGDVTIDAERFILRMNDGNKVIINIANFEKLKEYKNLYSTVNEKGTFNLNVFYSVGTSVVFESYELEKQKKNGDTDELPKDAN